MVTYFCTATVYSPSKMQKAQYVRDTELLKYRFHGCGC